MPKYAFLFGSDTNVELFQEIKHHIQEDPRRLDMNDWGHCYNMVDHENFGKPSFLRTE